jgi:hypothetical protein
MTRFLLVIVLLVTSAKLIAYSGFFGSCKYDFARLAAQDEESKQDKGEEEKSKYDNEDKIAHSLTAHSSLHFIKKSSKVSWQQGIYIGFAERPNTPPPNML